MRLEFQVSSFKFRGAAAGDARRNAESSPLIRRNTSSLCLSDSAQRKGIRGKCHISLPQVLSPFATQSAVYMNRAWHRNQHLYCASFASETRNLKLETSIYVPVFAFFTSSISGGTISNRLPTAATSAISKMGASASLLMATMVREPFMPTMCWMAPLMPSAR
jgi:hypothetical protein